jgi:Coenzyme PQQ synthesis protein D (PqqD)
MPQRFQVNPETVANRMGEQMVLVHLGTDRIFELNSSAARIWDLLVEGRDQQEIERSLCEEFKISKDLANQQTNELLTSLIAEKIIIVNDEE